MEETVMPRMEDQPQSRLPGQSQNFFSADLDPAELQRILARIEENLAFRQILKDQTSKPHGPERTPTLPPLPPVAEIDTRLQYLRHLRAPLFVPGSGRWSALIRRVLNIPLRLFGRKQLMFNNELLALLSDMALLLYALSEQSEFLISWGEQLQDMIERQQRIEESVAERQQRIEESVAERQQRIEESVAERQQRLEESVAERQQRLEESVAEQFKDMVERQRVTEEWIYLVQADVRDVAFEVREIKGDLRHPLASRILPATIRRSKLTGLEEELKVNLGCGHWPMDGYVNVDFRAIPEADMVAEVRSLPFQAGSVAELASSHVVEHFREYEFKTRILPCWHTLLKPAGVLRIICPNWEAMIHQLQAGEMTFARFKEITFGGQEYEGNDHFSMYTPETLTTLLQESGFSEIRVLVVDRDNGGCPEMELVAIKG